MIKKRKNIKESKLSSEYANLWKDALEMALEELESDHYGEMNTSEEMYFMLTDNYGEELGYQGFATFDRVEGDNLIMHTVYPESVSVLSSAERFLEASEEPDIDVSAIKSEKDKSDALEKIDDYIESLKSDQSSLKDYQWSEEQVEIAEEMNDKGYVEELEIELPDSDWIDFDEYEDEDDAMLNAMKDEIVSSLVGYAESVARKADDVISDARIEVGDLLDSYLDKISDAEDKRKEIEEIEFDDEEFESVRRRRNLRRVIESRRANAKKESSEKEKVWVDFYCNGEGDHGDEDVDNIAAGIKLAKDWVSKQGKNNVFVARVLSGRYSRPDIHFVATNAKKGNIEIDEPIDFFAGTTDRKFSESLRRRNTRK